MNAWSADNSYSLQTSPVIGASATNSVVSRTFPITARGALHLVLAVDTSSTTVATGITAKLQTAIGDTWVDSKTATISGDGRFYIKLNVEVAGDQTYLPLLSQGRVVVSTGAGDAVTIDKVWLIQEL